MAGRYNAPMSHTLRTAIILLAVGVALPLGMLYWAYDGNIPWLSGESDEEGADLRRDAGRSTERDSTATSTSDELAPTGPKNGPGAVPDVSHPPDNGAGTTVTAPQRGFTYRGVLRDRLGGLGEQVLTLVNSRGQERPVYTREDGAFSFVIKPSELPVRLRGPVAETVLLIDRPPGELFVYLNLTLTSQEDPEYRGLIAPLAASAEQELRRCRVRLYGNTRLDPAAGNRLYVRLLGGNDQTVSEGLHYVDGSQLLGEVSLSRELPYSGFYTIEIGWKPGEASAEEISRVTELLGGVMPEDGELLVRRRVYLGRTQDEELQERQIAEFYQGAIGEATGVFFLIHKLARELRGENKRIPSRFLEDMRAHSAYAKVNLLIENPDFPIESWRRLMDKQLPESWGRYLDRDSIPYREKYPKMAETLKQTFRKLSMLKKLESQLYYRKMGLPLDMRDNVDSEFPAPTQWGVERGNVNKLLKTLRRDFEQRRRRR